MRINASQYGAHAYLWQSAVNTYLALVRDVTTLLRMHFIDIPYVTLRIRGKHILDVGTWGHRATVCSEEYLVFEKSEIKQYLKSLYTLINKKAV